MEHISNFVEKGRRKISIVAFDSDNHVTHAERELVYNDYTSPVFSLDRPLRFSLNADDLTEGLSAEDCLDGTITDRIRISYEDEISSTPGLYHVTYSVANRAGDVTSLPVTVELYDPAEENGKPQITLSDYLIHLDLQQPFDPQAYLESVSVDQMLYEKREDGALHAASDEEELLGENQFSIDNPVDTGSAGVYEVTYTATAEGGADKLRPTDRLCKRIGGSRWENTTEQETGRAAKQTGISEVSCATLQKTGGSSF